MFRVRETGEIIDLQVLKARNPNVSFPASLSADDLEALGLDYVYDGDVPTPQKLHEVIYTGLELIDGKWTRQWSVQPFSDERIEFEKASRMGSIRAERDRLLASSDWTQLPDAPADKVAWAEYRQALRDITNADDPYEITWPSIPGA